MLSEDSNDTRITDLADEQDVEELVRCFYGHIAQDDLLGPLFEDVAKVDWVEHIPKLTQFWCRALFGTEGYVGNPFREHSVVHQKSRFTADHFHRWLELFHETVRLHWIGPNATRALQLARDVARVHSGQLLGRPIDVSPFERRP